MSSGRDNETPAVIAFGSEDRGQSDHGLPDAFSEGGDHFDLEEEVDEEVAKPVKKKGSGNTRLIMGIAISFLILMLCAGGYVVFAVMQKKKANVVTEEVFVPPQPVMVEAAQPPPIAQLPALVPEPVATPAAQIPHQQFQSAPETVVPSAIIAPAVSSPEKVQAPVVSQNVMPASGVTNGASQEALVKLESNQRALEKRISQLESLIHRDAADRAAKASAQEPSAVKKDEKKDVAPVAKVESKGVVKPAVKPLVTAKPVAKKPEAPVVSKAPLNEIIVSSPAERFQYKVSAIVNNRAFVFKRSPDGTEMEQGITVGDRLDGKLVTKVDAREREVVVEGGQRITTARFTSY